MGHVRRIKERAKHITVSFYSLIYFSRLFRYFQVLLMMKNGRREVDCIVSSSPAHPIPKQGSLFFLILLVMLLLNEINKQKRKEGRNFSRDDSASIHMTIVAWERKLTSRPTHTRNIHLQT